MRLYDHCDLDELPFAYLCGSCGLTHRPRLAKRTHGVKVPMKYAMEECACGAKGTTEKGKWTVIALPGADTYRANLMEELQLVQPISRLDVDFGGSFAEEFRRMP